MNERMLKAIAALKKQQDEIELNLKALKKELEEKSSMNMQKILFTVADDLAKYSIVDGYWYYNGKNSGIKAEGIDGKDGAPGKDGYTPVKGKDYFDGAPGKDGKSGKDGKDGKDGYIPIKGKDYFDGKDGAPGKDGKDGITPNLKIGKVETVDGNEPASAKLRQGKDSIVYLDLKLPRGPQGFMGFDGNNAKINGKDTIEIVAGDNITIVQDGNKLIISSTGGPQPIDGQFVTVDDKDFITSNDANFIVKESD